MNVDATTIDHLFTYHAPDTEQIARYAALRDHARHFAHLLVELCPPSAERTLAVRRLQETVMWANAAIALNEASNLE